MPTTLPSCCRITSELTMINAIVATEAKAPRHHDEREHRAAANRAVGISALGLALTGAIELGLAVLTGSVALLSDALHNLSDVSTSAVVFLGFRVSKRPPTKRYPHGYERAEDLAGLGVALVIWASAVFAGLQSYEKFLHHSGTRYVIPGMVGAVVGVIGNQLVARYKRAVGRRIQSATLLADAQHSWLDAISSVGALAGLIAVAFGFNLGDPIAGFAVTLFIAHVGFTVTTRLLHHLMDGVDESDIDAAVEAAKAVSGVHAVTVLGRWSGRSLVLDVRAELSPTLPLEQVTGIGRRVEGQVRDAVPAVRQVHWLPRSASEPEQ